MKWTTVGAMVGDLDPEQVDVMYSYVGLPLNEKLLDRDHDDYFRHLLPHQDLDDSSYLEPVS